MLQLLSAQPAVAVGIVLVALLLGFLWIVISSGATKTGMPGPPFKFWKGHLDAVLANEHRWHDYMLENNAKYGKDGFWVMSLPNMPPIYYLTDPDFIKHCMVTKFEKYYKAPRPGVTYDTFKILFGDGIFSSDGAAWREQRKLYSYMFSMKVLREHMFKVFESCSEKLIKKIDKYAESGERFDIQELFARATMDAISLIAFGQNIGCLDSEEVPLFQRAFDKSQELIWRRARNPLWKIHRFLNIKSEREFTVQMEIMENFLQKVLKDIRDGNYNKENFNIVELCLQRGKKNGREYDDKFLRDVVFSFCIAGRDTTACAMTWIMYELCNNPGALKKLHEEMDSLEDLSFKSILSMKYFDAIFFESQRIHPSVPSDGKQCIKDDILPNGHKIKAGYQINFNPYGIGRSKAIWGEDAEEFKPERYLENSKDFNEFRFPHFNVGARLCLGKTMATLESKMILTKLLSKFEFELCPDRPVHYMLTILLWVKDGLWVTAKRRE